MSGGIHPLSYPPPPPPPPARGFGRSVQTFGLKCPPVNKPSESSPVYKAFWGDVRKIRQYHSGFSRDYGNTQAVISDFCFTMTGLLLSPESTNESNPNYRHNFVGRINEKVHPTLSPKSYTGIKFDQEFISKK